MNARAEIRRPLEAGAWSPFSCPVHGAPAFSPTIHRRGCGRTRSKAELSGKAVAGSYVSYLWTWELASRWPPASTHHSASGAASRLVSALGSTQASEDDCRLPLALQAAVRAAAPVVWRTTPSALGS